MPMSNDLLAIGPPTPSRTGREHFCFSMARSTPTRTTIPKGNYVTEVGKYVTLRASHLRNFVTAHRHPFVTQTPRAAF